ncbi:MAG: leucine-rich repeat domain-containing protein [Lachnospiraceae bacterium]|nr:leucine-rich repeat domain-containing protein [Lachnospiraceae bacterium]
MERTGIYSWEYKMDPRGKAAGICITSVDQKEEYISVPEEIGGLPVLELGDYALENCAVREIRFPSSLERIGRYAFYNCEKLEKLLLYDDLKDVGTGAFTGVHRVHSICLYQQREDAAQTVLQELLSDFSETIQVTIQFPDREVRLLFPEYYEQGIENTPARIIVNQFFGTGMKYRNCFVNRRLQMEEYDQLFPLAAAGERRELVCELALLRLMYPWRLQSRARQNYMSWIREQAEQILPVLIREKRLEEIRLILEQAELPEQVREEAALLCAKEGFAAAVSLFMMHRDRSSQGEEEAGQCMIRSSFDLDEI